MNEHARHLTDTTTRAADGWPRKAWTHYDLDRMTEAGLIGPDEHVELIDGLLEGGSTLLRAVELLPVASK